MPFDARSLGQQVGLTLPDTLSADIVTPVTGGDTCQAYKIRFNEKTCFLKIHELRMFDMLQCEAYNLRAISETNTLRVPHPVACGKTHSYSYLLLDFLELHTGGPSVILGQQLARLHRHTGNYFGWPQDNWIGSTPQPNAHCPDWISFWRHRRLAHQLDLAKHNLAGRSLLESGERLLCEFATLFESYTPKPSLLHGDLWAGNYAFDAASRPVAYDPACYYGDRETDLAMTTLFGGFSEKFYQAYSEAYPLDSGYSVRKSLYNLYHVLNHFNLFGGSYARLAEELCQRVLSEIR